jgi:hypothetical protein
MMKRFGSAARNGGLREGKESVSTESRALENHPYTFFGRTVIDKDGDGFSITSVHLTVTAKRYRASTGPRSSRSPQKQRPVAPSSSSGRSRLWSHSSLMSLR